MHEYIVFFGDNSIRFTKQVSENRDKSSDFYLFESPFEWCTLINVALNSVAGTVLTLTTPDIEQTWKEFQENFTPIDAAGGIVYNELGELMVIERLNKWDLPKGKIEMGENPKEAAIREVEEECGIKDLTIESYCGSTYHVYTLNFQIVLKRTYWYRMSVKKKKLTPQESEGITNAFWIKETEHPKLIENTYRSIAAFLERIL
ncbi:MAG: NUDIX domain-containing protein [Salinivirgaceae bacterium]|nr:NUDIX domain-containing protein [Salinivirgaceae bacterium]MDD4746179.1 NUDIX domain-containing protein [Salinivirgaceae bacterium]